MSTPLALSVPVAKTASVSSSLASSSGFNDPAFAGNKVLPIHRWVPWIAGFSSDFVRDAIHRYMGDRKGVVLDTFSGVGTTLVEAVLAGHNALGFEINPYAALASRAKANCYLVNAGELKASIRKLDEFYAEKSESFYQPISTPPAGFKTRGEFYSPAVLRKVLIIQDYLATLLDGEIKNLFRLAFASTMVRYSNYSYEPSLGRRASSGKPDIIDFDVIGTVLGKLLEMAEDIDSLNSSAAIGTPDVRIVSDSFFNCEKHVDGDSVDLIVTSPPYLNNYHYNRNTRPHLYWLGYVSSPKDMVALEHANYGKYWQTVRDIGRLDLNFELPESGLAVTLDEIRKKNPEKGVYGGNGWANYAASYFNDTKIFCEKTAYVLKPGGHALVVIGNSILQGVMLPTDVYIGEIARLVGLELVNIDVPRATRVGSSIINSGIRVGKVKAGHQLYESVVVLKKPD